MFGIESGSWAEWVAGIAALALLAWTWWAWREDGRRRQELRRREIAARVNVWFEPDVPEFSAWGMVVENGGTEVVYEWEACVWWVRDGAPPPGPHWETRSLTSSNQGPLRPG